MPKPLITRRRFLYSSTVVGGAASLIGPQILHAGSIKDKVSVAFVGVGNKGAENLKNLAGQNVVALCDVDENFLNAAGQKHPGAKKYRDFRKLLEQKDIDAVVVTTPDHTHAVAAMAAIQLGKHVYCEKPLTHDIYEARQLARAAREHKVATQMGNGGHASEGLRSAVDWVRAGVIGEVREVHAWSNRPIWPQGIARPAETPPVPSSIDWNLWLSTAPERPYHPAYHPFKWRGWWDFGTGALGDMGCHIIDAAFWALDLGSPESVVAESSPVNNETAPSWSIVQYQFGARGKLPPVKLTWHDGGKHPPQELAELSAGEKFPENGSLFIGDKGKLFLAGRVPELLPESKWKGFQPPPRKIPRSPGHYQEWIEACKGGPAALSNFDYAGPLTEMVLLGNLALRLGKKIEWDGKNLQARNASEAAPYIRRQYRKGWSLD
jgi:predicted dehydrogenase